MPRHETIDAYTAAVCDQIRWKRARPAVAEELEAHILDQTDAYVAGGMDEQSAVAQAVAQMGDPLAAGLELDRVHRPKPQIGLLLLTYLLMGIGYGVGQYLFVQGHAQSPPEPLVFLCAGLVLALCYFWDFTRLGRHPLALYGLALVLCAVGLFLARDRGGAILYVGVDAFSFSAAYLTLVLPLAGGLLLYGMGGRGMTGLLVGCLGLLPPAVLLCLVPTALGATIYGLTTVALLSVCLARDWFGIGQVRSRVCAAVLILLVCVAGAALLLLGGQASHFYSAFHPEADPMGSGWAALRARESMAAAQWSGPAPAELVARLPGKESDYVLAALALSGGKVVFFAIAAVSLLLCVLGLVRGFRQKSVLGLLVAVSIMVPVTLQTVLYLLSNLGYGPPSLSLPFVSPGNTALLLHAGLVGLLLSVFRTGGCCRNPIARRKNRRFSYCEGVLSIRLTENSAQKSK